MNNKKISSYKRFGGERVKTYDSIKEAAEDIGVEERLILKSIEEKPYNTTMGLVWKRGDEPRLYRGLCPCCDQRVEDVRKLKRYEL